MKKQVPKILLVDDREDNLLSIEAILSKDGYELVKATSGRQALKILLTEYDFALILMDVKMPNLNGFETASMIYERDKLKHIPIIFITAHGYNEESVFRGYRAGAVDYIYKPINLELLRAKVSVFLELYKKNHLLVAQEKKLIAANKNLENEVSERKNSENQLAKLYESLRLKNTELEEANVKLVQAREQLADDRTRFLVQAMPHIVAMATPDGGLSYANQHLMDYTGMNFDELKGWGWTHAIHPEFEEKFLSSWQQSLAAGKIFQSEFRLRKADGNYYWHLALLKPFLDEGKTIAMWIVTLTDIHDQKIMDDKKDEFIALASHELKTPLTSAKAYIELLEQSLNETSDSEAPLYVKKANNSINRLSDLISELLDINKIEHGKLQFNISEFDFNTMIGEAIEHIHHSFSKHKVICLGETNKLIKGDKNKIQQVCINLLSNAIKYSPKANQVEVSINGRQSEIEVSVKDYGIGIPKSDVGKIFNKFYRVHRKTEKFQGLGVGLYLSSEIIRLHKGKIWVESEYGKGSTFYFTLPQN
jgi:PAS domain S-box-containing protein